MKHLLFILTSIVLYSCSEDMNSKLDFTSDKNLALNNTWELIYYKDQDDIRQLPEDLRVSIQFLTNDSVVLQLFCNNSNGKYQISGEEISINMNGLTEMACTVFTNNIDWESTIYQHISGVNTYNIIGGELFLYTDANHILVWNLMNFYDANFVD